jgi:hypothetical protein
MFDLSNITLAFSTAAAHDEAFALMQSDMIAWHTAQSFPSNQDLIAAIGAGLPHLGAASLKVYASRVLKWARSGQTPANIRAVVNTDPKGATKGKGGRPAGKGAGKTTKPTEDKAQAPAATVDNTDTAWRMFIEDMRSKVAGRKEWPSDRIVAFQDCAAKMIALLKSV